MKHSFHGLKDIVLPDELLEVIHVIYIQWPSDRIIKFEHSNVHCLYSVQCFGGDIPLITSSRSQSLLTMWEPYCLCTSLPRRVSFQTP